MKRKTQLQKILGLFKNGRSITNKQAISTYSIMKLTARIHELRHKHGLKIKTVPASTGYCKYVLAEKNMNKVDTILSRW